MIKGYKGCDNGGLLAAFQSFASDQSQGEVAVSDIPVELSVEGKDQQHKESKAKCSIEPTNNSKVIDVFYP